MKKQANDSKKTPAAKKPAAPAKKTAVKKSSAPAKKPAVKKTAPVAKKAPVVKKTAPVAKKAPAAKKPVSLKDRIIAVIKGGSMLAAVATVGTDKKPYVRIMSMRNDGLELASATYVNSKKVAHIKSNKHVSISILKDHAKMSDYITVSAAATICTDAKTKKAFWSPGIANYFKGPDDPNYCVIKFSPITIEFNDSKTFKTETLTIPVKK